MTEKGLTKATANGRAEELLNPMFDDVNIDRVAERANSYPA
eukprot:CAMPEP_0184858334 /NCGR_PEP_ID=MMETSP0580-20130426/3455_1 /TAXON_ID=1118495 /ORGANISM="Dactyliosolen fragilissimus" /LENGTH=40 /DNA_ID= /DNA_START= /DNA_END= /DNA_ORIENTATION=